MLKRACTLLLAVAIVTSGCIAAEMAFKGSYRDPRHWFPGNTRADVEQELGRPVSSRPTGEGGRIDTYEFKERPPSSGWANFHGFMSLFYFGAWNIIGIPIELSRGETRRLVVTYGPDDRVLASEAVAVEDRSAEAGTAPGGPGEAGIPAQP